MLGLAYAKKIPRVWTDTEVKQLVHQSVLPDRWTSGSIITYRLIYACIEEIKSSKLVMKHQLPQLCELLCEPRNNNDVPGIRGTTPLKPSHVGHFVAKVRNKMRLGETNSKIINSKVEFPNSFRQVSEKQARTQAWVNQLSKSSTMNMIEPEVILSDEMKMDIERVADESVLVLKELRDIMQDIDYHTDKYRRGETDRNAYVKAVQDFKALHQKNRLNGHHFKGKVDIIGVCCPVEVENVALQNRINEKHKKLVSEFYESSFHSKLLACDSLQGTSQVELRAREVLKIALINSELGINYNGEADPVDHAQYVKSFLEYAVVVVLKHVGKENADEGGETSIGINHGGKKHCKVFGSPEWGNSWQKTFDKAAADKRRLEKEGNLQKKIGGLRNQIEGLQNVLEELRREEDLPRLQQIGSLADLKKRKLDSDTNVKRVPRKKKKKEKKVPIFTGLHIAHLFQNEQRKKFSTEVSCEDPGAMMWMEALVLNPVPGQDMSNPGLIVYKVKYDKLDGIFEISLGKEYLDGNIIIHNQTSSDDEYNELTLAEVKKQALERMMKLRQNMHKRKGKKRPTTSRKSIPSFTGMKLAHCYNEEKDEDNDPLSSLQKKLWDYDSSSSTSSSNVSAFRWMEAKVIGPVPNQKSSDPYHTVYQVKYDELSEIYEVDLGRDYLAGKLISSDLPDSEPEPDELPLEQVLRDVNDRMSAVKRSSTGDKETIIEEKRQKIHDSTSIDKKNGQDIEEENPEDLAKKKTVKKLKDKIFSLSCLEWKCISLRDKRQREKTKSDNMPPVVRERTEKLYDEAVANLWDTRQKLDRAKKRLEDLGETYDFDDSDQDTDVNFQPYNDEINQQKTEKEMSSEEKKKKRSLEVSATFDKLDKLEKIFDQKQEISKHLSTEIRIAENEDKVAKKAANVDYWLSSPSKEVKEKSALYDRCLKETEETMNEIKALYDRLDELSSSGSEKGTESEHTPSDDDIPESSDDGANSTQLEEVGENLLDGKEDTYSENEALGKKGPEKDTGQPQKAPEVMELMDKTARLKAQEKRIAANTKQRGTAVTALKDFDKWQKSSSRPSRSRRRIDSVQETNPQLSLELIKLEDLYYKSLQSLVDIRKDIYPLLRKLKEMEGEIESDWSDDDECGKDWITKGKGECSNKQQAVMNTKKLCDDTANTEGGEVDVSSKCGSSEKLNVDDQLTTGGSVMNSDKHSGIVNAVVKKISMNSGTSQNKLYTHQSEDQSSNSTEVEVDSTQVLAVNRKVNGQTSQNSEEITTSTGTVPITENSQTNSEQIGVVGGICDIKPSLKEKSRDNKDSTEANMDDVEDNEKKTKLEEKRMAKVIKEKKKAEADVLDKLIIRFKKLLHRRIKISTHRWDEFELQKYVNECTEKSGNADISDSFLSEELGKKEERSVLASQRAEDAQKELKALKQKRNQIVISDSECSEDESTEEESSTDPSDDENLSVNTEEKPPDEPLSVEEQKKERRKELQEIFRKISRLRLTRRNLKWKYHKEITALKKSEYAASLTNVILKKEKLLEAATQRENETSDEYERHWQLMKEELSDSESDSEDSS